MPALLGVLGWAAVALIVFLASAWILGKASPQGPRVRRQSAAERQAARRENWRRDTQNRDR